MKTACRDYLGGGADSPLVSGLETDRLVLADNLSLMRSLPGGCCDLIYIDPPFSSESGPSQVRPGGSGSEGSPCPGLGEYLAFLKPRLIEMHRLLSEAGSLFVHLDWHSVHYVKMELDGIFGRDHFLNEIIWTYRSGGRPGAWFSRKHDTILSYAKRIGKHTFNRLRGGKYQTRNLRISDNGRPYKSTRNGPLEFHPDGPAVSDVWDIPFLSTVSKERTGYPTQKPERLLERIIRAGSNEGDLVADFFCGSGTTCVVAKRLKRRWLGADINPDAVAVSLNRLARTSCSG